jgi:TetR/AcrR family transcriptional repressor of lmrAB and yxaGH operons
MPDRPNNPARERILQAAAELMESQGYHGTGINQIIETSGSPKESLYHYFPEGKEALASEMLAVKGRYVAERIQQGLASADAPAEAVRNLILGLAGRVGEMQACPVPQGHFLSIAGVALETAQHSPRLRETCQEIYQHWHGLLYDKFVTAGYSASQAERLATTITAAIDGAIIQARL